MNEHPTILITGISGYIGSNLGVYLQGKGYSVYGVYNSRCPTDGLPHDNLRQADITDINQITACVSSILPDVIIHTAGLQNVEQCEKNNELATKINVLGTRNVIESIRRTNRDIKLVFISSDYVFDGNRGNYREEDDTNPQTFYGKTKAISEQEIRDGVTNFMICRTGAVYGLGGNFFNYVVANLTNERGIKIYDDVVFTPTYIGYFLDSVERLISKDFRGVVHVAGSEIMSRYSFALKIAEVLGKDKSLVQSVKQPSGGLISKDSSLDSAYVRRLLGNYAPGLEKSLHYLFGDLVAPYFYFTDERGTFTGLTQCKYWVEINYVESVGGATRGNHYHMKTIEGFYIIAGSIKVCLRNIADNSRKEFNVSAGDFFVIEPNIVHTFQVIEDTKWINMLSLAMDNAGKDIHYL